MRSALSDSANLYLFVENLACGPLESGARPTESEVSEDGRE
jgi:hypothetical protein